MNKEFKLYRKKELQLLRPYVLGEDLSRISVWDGDTPEVGGMIGINKKDETDQWYVAKQFYEDNYELG